MLWTKYSLNGSLIVFPSVPAGGAGYDYGHPEGEATKASGGGEPDQDPTGAV